jgi:hypothetical protein
MVVGSTAEFLQSAGCGWRAAASCRHSISSAARRWRCSATKVARELFPRRDPVGQIVRIGGRRMRVIGVWLRAARSSAWTSTRWRCAGGHGDADVRPALALSHPDRGRPGVPLETIQGTGAPVSS